MLEGQLYICLGTMPESNCRTYICLFGQGNSELFFNGVLVKKLLVHPDWGGCDVAEDGVQVVEGEGDQVPRVVAHQHLQALTDFLHYSW